MEGGIMAWKGLVATGQYEAGMFLIDDRKTPEELISLAWMFEDGTGLFYEKAGDTVSDQEARHLFSSLVSAEHKHKANLIDAYKKLKKREISGELLKNKTAQGFMESGVSLEDAVSWLMQEDRQLRDILEFSMQIETNSLDLYTKIFRRIDDKETGEIFLSLIEEEKAHLSRLGKLLGSIIKKHRTVS
jgi:rubrerythrin